MMTQRDILSRSVSEQAECNTALDVCTALNLQLYVRSPNQKTITGMLTGERQRRLKGWLQNGSTFLLPADIAVIRRQEYPGGLYCIAALNELSNELFLAFQLAEEEVEAFDWLAYGVFDSLMPEGVALSRHLLPSHCYYVSQFIADTLHSVSARHILTTGHFLAGTLADYAHVVLTDMGYEVDTITLDSTGFAGTAEALNGYGFYELEPETLLYLHLQVHSAHIRIEGSHIPAETIERLLTGREPVVFAYDTMRDTWQYLQSQPDLFQTVPEEYRQGLTHTIAALETAQNHPAGALL